VIVDRQRRVLSAIPGYLEPREFERRLAQFFEERELMDQRQPPSVPH
jgi:hypothetical protein